jgi:hypothetical protein
MMRNVAFALAVACAAPAAAAAQGIGVAARAGTLGLGAEATVAIAAYLAARGGIGVLPFEYSSTLGDVDYTIRPTSPLANAGLDFHPASGSLRLSAGLMFIRNTSDIAAEYSGTVEIGGTTYQGAEVGALTGQLDHGTVAPYASIGFGRRARPGIGFFLDLGAAFMSEPRITLTAAGAASSSQQFQQDLERERQAAEEDARRYLRFWPILSLGFSLGL